MTTTSVTDENFKTEVLEADGPVLVDFWAEWCQPCKMLGPILEEVSGEMNSVKIVKMNIEEAPETPTQYGVRGIPTLMLFKDGELTSTKVGAMPKPDLVDWLKNA